MTKIELKPGLGNLKCRRCSVCNGYGCIGQMPGLGGVFNNQNFQLNCEGWKLLEKKFLESGEIKEIEKIKVNPSQIRNGPVTGAMENIGYDNEEDFYFPYLAATFQAGMGICVGDGCPDEKLKFGVEAVKKLQMYYDNPNIKAAFFLKPYPSERLLERLQWVIPYADYIGIDIDAYNIATMRNLVSLEKKTADDLNSFRKHFDVPLVIKGVFTQEDLQLVRECKPDVVYFSNHGGRVETDIGSSADFFVKHAVEIKDYCNEVWVDGGVRSKLDVQTAIYCGADKVIIARPIITSVFDGDTLKLNNFF